MTGRIVSSVALLSAAVFCIAARAQTMTLGVMGDSVSDEYFEESSSYGRYATNWVQQVVAFRGVHCGPTAAQASQPGGTWGVPRRTGWQFNWARYGDTSADLIAHGQHTGLAAQAATGGVTHAVLEIGANDFSPFVLTTGAYARIYNGEWSAPVISNYIASVVTNIDLALATVLATDVRLVMFNLPDFGKTPSAVLLYSSAPRRAGVENVIRQVNARLVDLAQKYEVPIVDVFGLQYAIFGPHTNRLATLTLGNVTIQLQQADTFPILIPRRTSGFVEDGAHPHTTIQGLFASTVLETFDLAYGTDVAPFTEREILAHANLAYGGSDTLAAQIGEFSDYVILPIRPRVTTAAVVDEGVLQMQFLTASNQRYRVEVADELAGSWTILTNNVAGTGGDVTVTDTNTANGQRFYSVRQLR